MDGSEWPGIGFWRARTQAGLRRFAPTQEPVIGPRRAPLARLPNGPLLRAEADSARGGGLPGVVALVSSLRFDAWMAEEVATKDDAHG